MKERDDALRLLMSAMRGGLPEDSRWLEVVDIANRGWLVPALYLALERNDCLSRIRDEVRDYLALIHDRNRERNRRLRAQLIDTLRALNATGVQPVLLKGAITLFSGEETEWRSRMMSDLDIHIEADDMPAARAALTKIGYRETDSAHNLARPDDAGVLSLHGLPNARSRPYLSGKPETWAPLVERDEVTARVPTPTARALHLLVHDMIKEGDYWRLRINLRHLHDLALLSDAIDWNGVASALRDPAGRGSLALQLLALRELFGVDVPPPLSGGGVHKLRHRARLRAASKGPAASIARLIGRLSWGYRRFRESYSWRGAGDFTSRVRHNLAAPPKGSTL